MFWHGEEVVDFQRILLEKENKEGRKRKKSSLSSDETVTVIDEEATDESLSELEDIKETLRDA